jgi:hypothetical protein
MALANPLIGLFIASLINAVPSNEAFHPSRARCDLLEADLTGSGREAATSAALRSSVRGDEAGRDWRTMAQRCRSLAEWHTGYSRDVLLRLAEEYDRRAARGEPPPTDETAS